jgi:ABC-type Fe3+ transport system permease subunit
MNKMKFYPHRFVTDKEFSYGYLKILSFVLMVTSIGIFLYFFIKGNFHVHYIIATTCFLFLFCGILMWLNAYLAKSEKSIELTYEGTSKQIKRFGWLSLGAFYGSGICFFAGLILFAQKSDIWRSSIILFAVSILSLIIFIYGLIQRKVTKQHYELKKQQQEIIELLNETKRRDVKDLSNVLLA